MTSLRRRMTEDMQVRNLSSHTQATYVQQVSLFARHFNQSPEVLGPEEIRSYQVYLTNEKKLSPGSILIAVAALRFLYKVTLRKDWSLEEVIPAPKKPEKLPVVLSPEEVLICLRKRGQVLVNYCLDFADAREFQIRVETGSLVSCVVAWDYRRFRYNQRAWLGRGRDFWECAFGSTRF